MTFVFINGVLSGRTDDGEALEKAIIKDRRSGEIPQFVNVRYKKETDTVMITCTYCGQKWQAGSDKG
jgi:hypothetical protein